MTQNYLDIVDSNEYNSNMNNYNEELELFIQESKLLVNESQKLTDELKQFSKKILLLHDNILQLSKQSEILTMECNILNSKYINLLEKNKLSTMQYDHMNKSVIQSKIQLSHSSSWSMLQTNIIIEIRLLTQRKILLDIKQFIGKTYGELSQNIIDIFIKDYHMSQDDFCGMRWIVNGESTNITSSILNIQINESFINSIKIHKKINIVQHINCISDICKKKE